MIILGGRRYKMVKRLYHSYKELVVGFVIIMVAVAYLIGSLSIRRTDIVSLGAEFMPEIYGYFLLFLGICQAGSGIMQVRKGARKEHTEDESKDLRNVVLTFILIIVYLLAMIPVGFILSSIAFLLGLTFLLTPVSKKKNYIVYGIFSVVIPIAAWSLFYLVMNINLPMGILFGG